MSSTLRPPAPLKKVCGSPRSTRRGDSRHDGNQRRDDRIVAALAMARPMPCTSSTAAVAGSDTSGTAKNMAAAIKKQPFDLVICGTESRTAIHGIVPEDRQSSGFPPSRRQGGRVDGQQLTVKRQSESGYDVGEACCPRS